MNTYKKPDKVTVVYFTGTGGTRLAAEQFTAAFQAHSVEVYIHELDVRNHYVPQETDMLLVLYPVYAMNAPKPVYDFINQLSMVKKIPAAVFSVSGGGEITPNTASRLHTIRRLEKKGYRIVYEKMFIMPANALTTTPEDISLRLIEALPAKVGSVVNDLLSEVCRRTDPNLFNRFISVIGESLKLRIGGELFGRKIQVSRECNGCKLCARKCPMGNIKMAEGIPHFRSRCAVCLRCIYGCPKKALSPGIGKAFVLKEYNLNRMITGMPEGSLPPLDKKRFGFAYSGLGKYLRNEDE
jgi:ferredoxin